jgi:hypothetical protein
MKQRESNRIRAVFDNKPHRFEGYGLQPVHNTRGNQPALAAEGWLLDLPAV